MSRQARDVYTVSVRDAYTVSVRGGRGAGEAQTTASTLALRVRPTERRPHRGVEYFV